MSERTRYEAVCDVVGGVRSTVELRAVSVRDRRFGGPKVLGTSLVTRRVFGAQGYSEADQLHHELEETATALNDGTYGWSVMVERRGSHVRLRLVSRLFDGERFVVSVEADREFSGSDEAALEASASLQAELGQLAAERNEAAWQAIADTALEETERWRDAEQAQRDAAQLAGILRGVDR